jgi:hypothetical protein
LLRWIFFCFLPLVGDCRDDADDFFSGDNAFTGEDGDIADFVGDCALCLALITNAAASVAALVVAVAALVVAVAVAVAVAVLVNGDDLLDVDDNGDNAVLFVADDDGDDDDDDDDDDDGTPRFSLSLPRFPLLTRALILSPFSLSASLS